MFTVRKFLVFLLIMLVFLVSVSTASATGATTTRRIIREDITWTMTPEQCPSLLVPVSGKGKNFEVITTTVYPNGSQHIVDESVKWGTAWDSTGSYRFSYANHFVQDIPPGGAPIKAFMADIFALTGRGSAGHLTTGFAWRWVSNTPPGDNFPPNVASWQVLATIGEGIACDPI